MREVILQRSFLLFLIGLLVAGCAPSLKTRVLMPAEVNLKGFKRVAVSDFEGPGRSGRNVSRWMESALLKVRVGGKPYFKVITRTQLNKVLNEQKIQMVGLTDSATSKEIGKILGIDAIITGTIDGYTTEDDSYTEERTKYVKVRDENVPQTYYVKCTERRAYVSLTVNFIDVQTGNIEVSEPTSHQIKNNACGGARKTKLTPRSRMLKNCAQQAISQFVKKTTPHYEWQELALKGKDDSAGGGDKATKKMVNTFIKSGCEYAKEGVWESSLAQFQKAVQLNPNSPAANYDLAVIYEIKGDLYRAKEHYEKAANLKPDSDYVKAVSHINRRISEHKKLKKQLR